MDQDLFISVLKSLSPQAIKDLNKKPIEAQCIFTQQPDCQDDQQFVEASVITVFQIRQNYLLQCEPKSRKISGGIQLSLDYSFQIIRYANQSQFSLGKPYGFILQFPIKEEDEEQTIIKLGVKIQCSNSLQKFATCLGTKLIYQRNVHNNFKVIERVAFSTSAALYSAVRILDKKQVVIKCIKKDMLSTTGRNVNQVLIRQYGIPKSINHQNICQYYGLYCNQDSVYIVMQKLYVNFLAYLNTKLWKNFQEIKNCFKKICIAVSKLHQNCIMHRDIKPQNIMIRKKQDKYQPVLIDFGLAQYQQKRPYIFNRCGTPGYAAPEIVGSKSQIPNYNHSCDIFSLGSILHIVLVRRPLFQGQTSTQVLQKNIKCQIDKNHERYKNLTTAQKDILFRMIQKQGQKRIKIQQVLTHQFFTNNIKSSQQSDIASNQILDINNQCDKQN